MLEGIVVALKKYNHSQKIVNEVVACVAVSWIKFTDEAEAMSVLELLNELLPLVKESGPEIA